MIRILLYGFIQQATVLYCILPVERCSKICTLHTQMRAHTHTNIICPTFSVSSLLHVFGCLSSRADHLLPPIYCIYPQLCSILLVVFHPMPKQTPIRELCIKLLTSVRHSLCHIHLEFALLVSIPVRMRKISQYPQTDNETKGETEKKCTGQSTIMMKYKIWMEYSSVFEDKNKHY